MPMMSLGVGAASWRNNTATAQSVLDGLLSGFPGIDTANNYRNQLGVAEGIKQARRKGVGNNVWLQTKVQGCGNSLEPETPVRLGRCFDDTLDRVAQDLKELDVSQADLMLLHSPPCLLNASWVDGCGLGGLPSVYPKNCNCAAQQPCEMMQHQWLALEKIYKEGRARAIGVSNFCQACLQCIREVWTIVPHVNQFNFHVGMLGEDPAGLISYTESLGIVVQAYRPLGHGSSAIFDDPTITAIGNAHNKSTAQVAQKWIAQLGHPLITSTLNPTHMKEDLEVFSDWDLTMDDMKKLSQLNVDQEDPVGSMCILGSSVNSLIV